MYVSEAGAGARTHKRDVEVNLKSQSKYRSRQIVVLNLKATHLKGVLTEKFTMFVRLQSLYEKQVAVKNSQVGMSISRSGYNSGMGDALLRIIYCRMD